MPFKFKNTDYNISRPKLIENKKKSRIYALIWDYSFINFHKKVPPIRLFPPILLFIFELSHLFFMLISLFTRARARNKLTM